METKETLRNLVTFFVLAFAISWLLWLPQVLASNDLVQLPEFVGLLGMFAPFGPFIAAFWLTGRQSGREGIKRLLKRGWSLDFDKLDHRPGTLDRLCGPGRVCGSYRRCVGAAPPQPVRERQIRTCARRGFRTADGQDSRIRAHWSKHGSREQRGDQGSEVAVTE